MIITKYLRSKWLISILIACVFISIGLYFYRTYRTSSNPVDIARQEADEVKKGLSKHLVLPEGEEPDIRKINQKLDDPFFANATIGDYLIIFYKSRIAYTYSPSRDIITNAGVVFVNAQNSEQATSSKK